MEGSVPVWKGGFPRRFLEGAERTGGLIPRQMEAFADEAD